MAGANIWALAYKGVKVPDVEFDMGTQSATAVSKVNTGESAVLCTETTRAMVAFFRGLVSFGRTATGLYYAEAKGHVSPARRYVAILDPAHGASDKLKMFAADGQVQDKTFKPCSDTQIHWSVFVARVAQILAEDAYGEFAIHFKALRTEWEKKGKITTSVRDDLYICCDYLYATRHLDFITSSSDIAMIDLQQTTLAEDLTEHNTGKDSDFAFAVLAQPGAFAPKSAKPVARPKVVTTAAAFDKYKLPWDPPLSEADRSLIPNFDLSKMKFTDWLMSFFEMVRGEYDGENPVKTAIFYGEGGSGKSTACKLAAQVFGLPYSGDNFSHGFEEANLIGMYRPSEKGFDFYTPKFAQRFERGGIYEAAEFNFAKPGALGVLNSALDDTAVLTLGDGRTIRRHRNFFMIATLNVDYAGTQMLNQALKDRFQLMINVPKPSKQDLIDIIMWRAGLDDADLIGRMIEAGEAMAAEMEEREAYDDGICSLRQWIGWAQAYKRLGSVRAAARLTVLPGISLDRKVQDEFDSLFLMPRFS